MRDFLSSWVIAFSFFTVLPLPMVEWSPQRMRHLPRLMPWVGLGIGGCTYLLFVLLQGTQLGMYSKGVVMTLASLVFTGGLHMDGLMDMGDAYFSRATKEKRLEIMKDSRVGAFGVMTFVGIILLKVTCFAELANNHTPLLLSILFIPVLSRIVQALMLCFFPYAKKDGLAATFKVGAGKGTQFILGIYVLLVTGVMYIWIGSIAIYLVGSLTLFSGLYYFWVKKNFGGITGDIVGGFVEIAELMLLTILVVIQ